MGWALGIFNGYLEKWLLKRNDFESDLLYWVTIIGDSNNESKDDATRKALWNYIVKYKFSDVICLLRKFGYDITVIAKKSS